MEQLIIKCTATGAILQLELKSKSYQLVSFRGENFSGVVLAYDIDWNRMSAFFEEIAREWRGWKGGKRWSTLEGCFCMEAFADRLGHVTLIVKLNNHDGEIEWNTSGAVRLESGSLESLAKEVRSYFKKF